MALIVAIRASGFNFHGGNSGSNPVGDAKSFQPLMVFPPLLYRHKKGTILGINANAFH